MKRKEKISAIKNYVWKTIKGFEIAGTNYDCITNINAAIQDFAVYFPYIREKRYTYITRLYVDKVMIVTHNTIYVFGSHVVDEYVIPYEKLTDRDLDELYKVLNLI